MVQFEWHDGTMKNIHVDPPSLYEYQVSNRSNPLEYGLQEGAMGYIDNEPLTKFPVCFCGHLPIQGHRCHTQKSLVLWGDTRLPTFEGNT